MYMFQLEELGLGSDRFSASARLLTARKTTTFLLMYLAVVVDESTGTSKTTTTLTTTLLRLLLVRCSDTTLKQYDTPLLIVQLLPFECLDERSISRSTNLARFNYICSGAQPISTT
ncbi:hypothetical protein QR680_010957 [Steinernema hermaphroditum]|uniref:Uncharacterized protein n=1 Tax=Steinernema hermaphroditum TaxID=289476 RepID=A0AA39MCE4_9BILA|nr:hypothetical protein QR680_010957 [Steinernema hermaphroditum]